MASRLLVCTFALTFAVVLTACCMNQPCCCGCQAKAEPAPAPAPEILVERRGEPQVAPLAEPPAPVVVRPAASAMSRRTPSATYGRPGFEVFEVEGRLWIFKQGSKHLAGFHKHGEPAKNVTLVGQGPAEMTMRGAEKEVLHSYMDAWRFGKPGFAVFGEDGRLWVFRVGSPDLDTYLRVGEPAKSVTLVGVGPEEKTVRGPDRETLEAYLR